MNYAGRKKKMQTITEFLSNINIWLAVALVDFGLFFLVYSLVISVKLVLDTINPREYTEKNDIYEQEDGETYYDLKDYQDDYPY